MLINVKKHGFIAIVDSCIIEKFISIFLSNRKIFFIQKKEIPII